MRSIRDTAATKIAEAKKEIAEIVAKLKKDHTAEEAAPCWTSQSSSSTRSSITAVPEAHHPRSTLPNRSRPRKPTRPTP